MKHYSCILALFLVLFWSTASSAPAEDEVIDLPGLPNQPSFKHYSGYLEATDGRQLHYWFVECESDSSNAPLILWMNGGPGCSSVDGLLTGHGPFHVNGDSKTLYYNPYSWNKVANVIYLEAPAGVGFSYSNSSNYTTNDDQTAADNYQALSSFFEKFPEFSQNVFYITGESYAAVYVPTLAKLVIQGSQNINFKGVAIGNGCHNNVMNVNSAVLFAAYHGLIDQSTMMTFLTYCCQPTVPPTCNFYPTTNATCAETLVKAVLFVLGSRVNPYSIYSSCETPYGKNPDMLSAFGSIENNQIDQLLSQLGDPGLPCQSSAIESAWINQPEVRVALHIPEFVQEWTDCSSLVSSTYGKQYPDMSSFYDIILPLAPAVLYHGDTDVVCNFIGGEWFSESLNQQIQEEYHAWTYANQTAGFAKVYSNQPNNNLTYLTVLGSGHMVPTDKPAQCLEIITRFINSEPFN